MRFTIICLLLLPQVFSGCRYKNAKNSTPNTENIVQNQPISYIDFKAKIAGQKRKFADEYSRLHNTKILLDKTCEYWVNNLSKDMYNYWQGTAWDFNGTTTIPKNGTIACGYFVNTILQDMGCKINRIKLSICPSSVMMKSLVPGQSLINLSALSYTDFCEKVFFMGKGVYIIGLDFHTGFIVHDGTKAWFIHSNYIGRKGVTKEPILHAQALQASKTRWMVSLTGDKRFIKNWLQS
jgi:hypothetical protein